MSAITGTWKQRHVVLERYQPDRKLYLALTRDAYARLFEEPIGQTILEKFELKLLVFDPDEERITQWIPKP